MEYRITVTVGLRNPMLDSVNETMKGFGFDEKMVLVTDQSFIMTVARELAAEEKEKMIEVIEKQFSESELFNSAKVIDFAKVGSPTP